MAYGLVMDVPAPIGLYDALHAEIGRRAPGGADGLLVHVGRETPVGFQIWRSGSRRSPTSASPPRSSGPR